MSATTDARLASLSNNKDAAQLRFIVSEVEAGVRLMTEPHVDIVTAVNALIVDITALATALDVVAGKLNADDALTDVDYSVVNAAAITAVTLT